MPPAKRMDRDERRHAQPVNTDGSIASAHSRVPATAGPHSHLGRRQGSEGGNGPLSHLTLKRAFPYHFVPFTVCWRFTVSKAFANCRGFLLIGTCYLRDFFIHGACNW